MKRTNRVLPLRCLGAEKTLVDCVYWAHLLEDWEGLREKDLIGAVGRLELPVYRYRECRVGRGGELIAKASRIQPYSIWHLRRKEEQDDHLEGGSPPQDFIVRQKFEDIFTGYDVVMTKKDVLKLEAKHPDWKLPHFDPQAPRTLAESDLESPEKMAQRLNKKYKELKSKERKLALTGALDSAFPRGLSHADLGALIRQDGEVDSFAANKKRGRDYRMKLQSRD